MIQASVMFQKTAQIGDEFEQEHHNDEKGKGDCRPFDYGVDRARHLRRFDMGAARFR